MAGTATRRAAYKDTLQPALHRRFSSTASLLLAVSYLEALLLARWSSYFWSWFPLGPSGIRAALIFAGGLTILVLRIAHYHVGFRTTESGLRTVGHSLLRFQTYETGLWYCASSMLFCPVFLFSMSASANLQWVTYFSGNRARLNERPLFLASYLGTCALVQTIMHYRLDLDRLDLGSPRAAAEGRGSRLHPGPVSFATVLSRLPFVLASSVQQATLSLIFSLILYHLFFRSFAWGWALTFLRPFYSLPKTSMLPPTWPSDVYLLMRCIYAGSLINFLWSSGNMAFSTFMGKEPLKNGSPLTSDAKDPNGSLLSGLKSKKLSVKAFATWELALIAQRFEVRRKGLYGDIDRKEGPMWCQVYAVCMELVKDVESRVDNFGKPIVSAAPESKAAPSEKQQQQQQQQQQQVSVPPREEAIFNQQGKFSSLRGGAGKMWDDVARSPGSSPASELSPLAKKAWRSAKDRMLSKQQQEALTAGHLTGELGKWATKLMAVGWIGALLRHDFGTRFTAVVLGTPYAEPMLYMNAVEALCQLAVHSLTEDQYGNVHRDVPDLIRSLTSTIRKVEALKENFPRHWTDPGRAKNTLTVDRVLNAWRGGLAEVVAKFDRFGADLGLSPGDLRLAKETAAERADPRLKQPLKQETRRSREGVGKKAEARRGQKRTEQRRGEMEQVSAAAGRMPLRGPA